MIPTLQAAIERIRAFAKANKWRPTRFAREAGLSVNALRDFDDEAWSPNIGTLQALEKIIPADFVAPEVAEAQPSEAAA